MPLRQSPEVLDRGQLTGFSAITPVLRRSEWLLNEKGLMTSMTRAFVPAMVVLAVVTLAAHQEGPVAQFSSQVQLVEVYATVTDAKGGLVTGLRQEDFQVYENNQIQSVSTFAA